MNRLQLVQRLHTEAAATGSTPTTTLSQTGLTQKLINWIDAAYQDIQNLHVEWDFLRDDFSFTTGTVSREYSLGTLSLTELNAWFVTKENEEVKIYSSVADETFLIYEPWELFNATYMLGNYRTMTGRPYFFSIKPDKTITFDLIPDAVYTVSGEYFKKAQEMATTGVTANTDEPLIPSQYHMAIVYRALMFYGAFKGADEVYSHGEKEFSKLLSALELDQLPQQSFLWGSIV